MIDNILVCDRFFGLAIHSIYQHEREKERESGGKAFMLCFFLLLGNKQFDKHCIINSLLIYSSLLGTAFEFYVHGVELCVV